MKKIYLVLSMLAVFFGTQAQVAVTVTNPTNTTPALAASYVSLAAAITDLNLATTISGPVIFTCATGTETAPVGGYVINFAAATTIANNVVIDGTTTTITANGALTAGVLTDAIFKIIGSDNVTIQNFRMLENAANTTTAAATNNMTEFGVALFYATTTNGAQNNTIQNNTITLNKTYQNTFGIYSNSSHSSIAITAASATTTAGGNSGLKIYSNIINNVNNGIAVVGPTAAADFNNGIDIGGTSIATANTISNYGTTGTFSSYNAVSGTIFGVLVRNATTINVSYNNITSSGTNTAGTLRAIYVPAFSVAPTGTFTNTLNNNTISVATGLATGALQGITMEATTGTATSIASINNNNFINVFYNVASPTGAVTIILDAMTHLTTSISNNTFTNLSVNTTGNVTLISNSITFPPGGSQTISNNAIVTAFAKTLAGGTVTGITTNGSSTTGTSTWSNNNFSNITVTGATALTVISNTDGGTMNHNITGNIITNITGGTSSILGIVSNFGGGNGGLGNLVNNNTITSISSTGAINAIQIGGSGTSSTVSGNTIAVLSTSGASQINAIISSAPVSCNIFKNNVSNISGSNASSTINGITILAGTLTNAYNNFISDLRAPSASAAVPIYGINIAGGTTANIYYNTIALGKAATLTSTGTQFGVTGIGYSSTTNTTLRNNIVWIDATPVGTGAIAAVRRSAAGTAGTAPTTTSFNSNNNIYYVLTATGASPVIANLNKYLYLEGNVTTTATNGYGIEIGQVDNPTLNLKNDPNYNTSCGLYKTFMGARETATFTENNLTAGAGNTFAPTGSSFAAENAQVITTPAITDDYSSIVRSTTLPDIGALEFAGTGLDAAAPSISFTALTNTVCITGPTLAAVITDASGINTTPSLAPRIYYRKGGATAEADVFLNYPAENTNAFNGWKYVEATGTAPNFSFAINYSLLQSPMVLGDSLTYFVVAQDNAATPNVGKNSVTFPTSFCPASVVIPALGAVPTSASLGYKIIVQTATTNQPLTTSIPQGTTNVQVLRVDLPGAVCLGNITQLDFTNVSTSIADISKARVYYTTTTTFATTTQFGSDVTSPGATFSVTGTQASALTGTNYFWLVFDVTCAATVTNVVDASCTNVLTTLGSIIPATANPAGTRAITLLTSGDQIQTAPLAILGIAGGNSYDIAGKSLQTGEPSPMINAQPTLTNGSGSSNYSWTTAAGGTQWYRLVVPTTGYGSSGNLLIRAVTNTTPVSPSADVQVAIWKFPNMVAGSICTDPANFTGGYMLAANDDAIVTGVGYNGTSGSTLNSVIRTRLTAGQTYYIQLDGFNANLPIGDLIIEDLADPSGKNVSNNGFGAIHNPTAVNMLSASYEVIGDDGWTYYYNNNGTTTDIADDVVLIGLNWSTSATYLWNGTSATGNDLLNHVRRSALSLSDPGNSGPSSATGLDAFVVWSGRNNATAASNDLALTDGGYVISLNWWMMNKFWNVFPNQQPITSVGVRTFYSDADYLALQTVVTAGGGTLASPSAMQFIKATKGAAIHYTNAETDPGSGHAAITAGTVTSLTWTNTTAVQTGINQAQFAINSFSGGGGGSTGAGSVLPYYADKLNGSKQGNLNLLDWKVSCVGSANIDLTLERSADGRNFTAIQQQNANYARCEQQFNYTDATPLLGANYYRVKIVTPEGRVRYTTIVVLLNKEKGFELISLAPNPAIGKATLTLTSAKAGKIEILVRDIVGKNISGKSITVIAGNNPIDMNFATLNAGTYSITAINADGEIKTIRFVKY